ncbi:alpha-1,4-N-acetylglucosaminyltransferase-like [Hyla sarda]|uniref:alpha-1,4-N-acetylglucosaminyltransferase-like n=1 Tax=Hyla sarda TaxID=327740 RepID=UPI0024C39769|nr:alpha-1,4-N-acetylglucosaminyltransferase-like [Hyla sarda]
MNPYTILNQGNGILFVETTKKMNLSSLVLCAIESAARVYPDRPVVFFLKGLNDITTEEEENRIRKYFPTLSSYKNIYFFPLRMEELFMYTPLVSWYKKVHPKWERFWTHVSSDACRFAMMWKYGGIYMDTDIISLHPVPTNNFIAAESSAFTSSSVFGLSPFHSLTWEFMQNFVENYRGNYWGYQGPRLFTRVMHRLCGNLEFKSVDDNVTCGDVSYLHPERFYPIVSSAWKTYFEVWKNLPTFNRSYGLHFWNYMNKERETMVPESSTLAEHLYQQHCPLTYGSIQKNKPPPQ